MSTKDRIAEILEKNRGHAVSGQELADTLSISRSAVWKAVTLLKKDGYRISAVSNVGYMLECDSDVLSEAAVLAHTDTVHDVTVLDTVDSTNTYAKKAAADGAKDGSVILSRTQTAGRGRRGKSFFSPCDTGLYMSIIRHPKKQPKDIAMITVAAAVAVSEAIESLCGCEAKIKWVNDIFINNKKVCGILTEAVTDLETGIAETVIVGIGVNMTTESFPDGIDSIAASLECRGVTRSRLAAEIINRFDRAFDMMDSPEIIQKYRQRSLVIGKDIFILHGDEMIPAHADSINDAGNLIVTLSDGTEKVLSSGEVSVRLEKK